MVSISSTKRKAFEESFNMAKEGKDRQEIVNYLVANYLYDTRTAYSLANAAIWRKENPIVQKEAYDV